MDYIKLSLTLTPKEPGSDMAMALLADIGFESFVDTDLGIDAFITEADFDQIKVDDALSVLIGVELTMDSEKIPHENWNEKWEEGFHPVLIDEKCLIRAPFHDAQDVEHDIIIKPQMSFGTGHHETTEMMVSFLLEEGNLKGKRLLDVGTGTGVLAILGEQLGAVDILATDIEDYIVENTLENVSHNCCVNIAVEKADLQRIRPSGYAVTLANINLNALLHEMEHLAGSLSSKGRLYLSGFYEQDSSTLIEAGAQYGLRLVSKKNSGHWTALKLTRAPD